MTDSRCETTINALRDQVRRQGVAVAPGCFAEGYRQILDKETAALIANWESCASADQDYWWYEQHGQKILYRIHNFEHKSLTVSALLESDEMLRLFRHFVGDSAHLTACALIYKMPHVAGPVRWHRDPKDVPAHNTYNFSFFLDDSTFENGCFGAVPGSHLNNETIEDIERDPIGVVQIPTAQGDVLIHDVRLIHGSWNSRSPKMRRSVIVEISP
jgi:hypothetical protein